MLTVKPLTTKDVKSLAQVYARVYDHFKIGEKWTPKVAEKLIKYWLGRQKDLTFIACQDKQIAGGIFAAIEPGWDGPHLIDADLFVDPLFQHHGVGTELLKMLLNTAQKKYHPTACDIYTFKHYDFPFLWYKKLGFREIPHWRMIGAQVDTLIYNLYKH